jgi:competence protein ComEC
VEEVTFNFLDVGQGDGTFIFFPDGSTMLIDLGSTKNAKIIRPEYLNFFDTYWDQGMNNDLTYLVLTHGDQDHYNLVKGLFDDYKLNVGEIYIGGEITDYGVGNFDNDFLKPWNKKKKLTLFPNNCSSGLSTWKTVGGVNIYVLRANFDFRNAISTNKKSVVLLFEYHGNKIILGGDATLATEKEIIRYYRDDLKNIKFIESDFMKVNHHGSETSSCTEWIKAVNPVYAFISADMRDDYLLPRCPIINRIIANGSITNAWPKHPYTCYDRGNDDWNNNNSTRAIFNSLAKYTVEVVKAAAPKGKKPPKKMAKVEVVTGHGVRYTVTFKDDGNSSITNSGYPK